MKDTCSFQSLFCEIIEFPATSDLSLALTLNYNLIHWINVLQVNKEIFINSFSEILIHLLLKNNVLVKDMPHKS